MDSPKIATLLVAGLLAGAIAGYAIATPGPNHTTTFTSVSTNTQTVISTSTETTTASIATSDTSVINQTLPMNTTVASGYFVISNTTIPANSYHSWVPFNHTGDIIATFVVTNQTHLSFSFSFTTMLGGGGCFCSSAVFAEVLNSTGQVVAKSGVPVPNTHAWVVPLPPSPQTSQGLQKYYLQILNDDSSETWIFYPNVYLY